MARKQKKISQRMLFTWFILAGFILFFTPESITGKFHFAFTRLFKWPLNVGRSISLAAARTSRTDMVSRREYEKLQNHLANLTEELNEGRRRFEKLHGLYNSYVWDGVTFVLADVITASVDRFHSEIVINCGQDKGLSKGQFVLGDNSIIGTVSEVSAKEARIRLISDPASVLAANVAGLDAVVRGCGEFTVKIKMIPQKNKIKLGEHIFVQRKPNYLDAPMTLGTIRLCETDPENPLLWDITVEPACDLESLKDVAVIIINPR